MAIRYVIQGVEGDHQFHAGDFPQRLVQVDKRLAAIITVLQYPHRRVGQAGSGVDPKRSTHLVHGHQVGHVRSNFFEHAPVAQDYHIGISVVCHSMPPPKSNSFGAFVLGCAAEVC